MNSEFSKDSLFERLALARARNIVNSDHNFLSWVLVTIVLSIPFFIAAFLIDGGVRSFGYLGLMLLIIALLHLERAGFKALLDEYEDKKKH